MGNLANWLPGLTTLREYQPGWLRHDLMAGLVLTTMLVPVGIAYAVASGLPGVYGLYATIVPLLAYALFGPSRILVLGPDSSLAPIILAVVLANAGGDPLRAVSLAAAMAVVSGLFCILAGVLKLGFVTELLSKPIRYGYMNGIALTVLISQLPKFLGFSIHADGPLRSLWSIAESIASGSINWTAFAVGAATLAVILLLKGSNRLPGVLVAVIGATVATGLLGLGDKGVAVLGSLPEGLPSFAIPWIGAADLGPVLLGGAAVALVSFADTSVLSRAYAARLGRPVDANQEMLGLGAANLAAGFFLGFPISSSPRTPVARRPARRPSSRRRCARSRGVAGGAPISEDLPTPALAAGHRPAIGLIEAKDCAHLAHSALGFWSHAVPGGRGGAGRVPHRACIVVAVIEFPRWLAAFRFLGASPAITTSAVIRRRSGSGPVRSAGMRCSLPTPT